MISALLSLPVASFIKNRAGEFRPQGVPIESRMRASLESFFPNELLDSVRIVTGRRVTDPLLAKFGRRFRLGEIPSFRDVGAVTFSNVIVFHEPVTLSVLFHEMVHVAQYSQLGIGRFARLYVIGLLRTRRYEEIPLEHHAYELGFRFEMFPEQSFSVTDEVTKRINERLY